MTTFRRNLFAISQPFREIIFLPRNKNTNKVKYYGAPPKKFKYRQSMYPSSIQSECSECFVTIPPLIPRTGRGRGVGLREWGMLEFLGGVGIQTENTKVLHCNGCLCKRVIISSDRADCGLYRVGGSEFWHLRVVDRTFLKSYILKIKFEN